MAFESYATNLGPGSSGGGVQDIYVYDSQTDTIEWITHTPSGGAANGNSYLPTISADGRYVTFASSATNLGPGGSGGGIKDIYLYDRVTDVMTWITHSPSGGSASASSVNPVISADGSTIAFQSTAKNLGPGGSSYYVSDIYLYHRVTGTLEWITQTSEGKTANGSSMDPTISGDGRYIAFETVATNLGPNPYIKFGSGNSIRDIFVYDQVLGTMNWITISPPDVWAIPLGGPFTDPFDLDLFMNESGIIHWSFNKEMINGEFVDDHIYSNLNKPHITTTTHVYFYGETLDGRKSKITSETYVLSLSDQPTVWASPSAGTYYNAVEVILNMDIPGNIYYSIGGSYIIYSGPIIITESLTLRFYGISDDGNYSNRAVEIYKIIQAPIGGINPSISEDGTLLAFESGNILHTYYELENGTGGNTSSSYLNAVYDYLNALFGYTGTVNENIYVYNMNSAQNMLITQTATGGSANGSSSNPSLSGDGNYIAFETYANNLGIDPSQPYGSNMPGINYYGNLRKDIFIYRDVKEIFKLNDEDELKGINNANMVWVTKNPNYGPANGNSYTPSLNYYGNIISYSSSANNLGPGGTGTYRDIFMEIGELVLNVYPEESIQNAINIASDGGTIIVHGDNGSSWTYIENLVINHPLTIISADDGAVIIEAANVGQPVVFINNGGSGSIVDGFIIIGGWTGVCLDNTSGNTIKNNGIGFNQEGVYITNGSTGNSISNNDIEFNSGNGVDILSNSTGNLIEDNVISNNGVIGVLIRDSNSNTLSGNEIQNNGWAGIALDNADGNQINGYNYISGNQEGINISNSLNNTITGNNITGNANIGISLINNSNSNYITNNSGISNNGLIGVFIRNSTTNTLSGNYIQNNGWLGICLDNADNTNINGSNTISGNLEGLYLVNGSNGNTITGNNIQYNNDTGIYIENCTGNNITSNTTISHNGVIGIFLRNANSNTISGNTIDANTWVGIALDNSDSNNINGKNTISGSAMGIYITNTSNLNTVTLNNIQNNIVAGLVLDQATNTKVYSNNFYNNPLQAQADNGSGNAFYRLSSGNYWSDWPSTAQRPIAGNEGLFDRYPKTTPF